MKSDATRPSTSAAPAKLTRVKVVVVGGPDKGLASPLEDGPVVIGKDPSCDLVLTDDTVSARHCELVRLGDTILLRDLGSTNGTFVSGVRIREAMPGPGTRFEAAETRLALKAAGEEDVLLGGQDHFGRLTGTSAAMRQLFTKLESIARSDGPLLIEGETGTGKDLAAEAVHRASGRADGPLVTFDCGAVVGTLLEAELFGHEKGAFTGAAGARTGLAEAASGGTLVLDEIGELALDVQPKLLRLIERREIRPVGSTQARRVDARIVACTHRSLRAEVKAGRFREDLFFRLSALHVRLPALRERPEDLPALVDHLLAEQGSRRRFADLSESDRALLLAHRWPGNVRELRNVVERLLTFPDAPAQGLLEADVSRSGVSTAFLPLSQAREKAQDAFERAYLREALARAGGSVTEAARLAGVSRQFVSRLAKKHALR